MNPESPVPLSPVQPPAPDTLPTGTKQPITPTPEVPPVTPPEPPKPMNRTILIFIVVLTLVGLGALGYWAYQSYFSPPKPTTEINTPTPVSTIDPTADWETYNNSLENFSFRYPPTWTIDTKEEMGDERKENIKVYLTKDQAEIKIYANMVGIGGQGQNYEGEKFSLDGNSLFLYKSINTYEKTQVLGITNSLTESLGVFKKGNKTYSITLSYPLTYSDTEASATKKEFLQILSTFKLLNNDSLSYQLSIPSSWEGHYYVTKTSNSDVYTYKGGENYRLFSIIRTTPDEWTQLQTGPSGGVSKLYSDSNYVYYISISLDNPLTGDDGNLYQTMSADIPNIKNGFKLTQ